jgi:hypothetical protein
MNRPDAITIVIAVAISLSEGLLPTSQAFAGDKPIVRFDLAPVVAAGPSDTDPIDPTRVTLKLRLSSMIESPNVPRIDQWLVRCQPRDKAISIADYAPRTETSTELTSPIQVKQIEEKNSTIGLSIDGSYGHAAHGNTGADIANKNTNTLQFDRVAPVQVVTASGTINRGRGVYFKLRWTAQQVLEGEKVFDVTLRVPATWRGGLIDVSVIAQSDRKKIGWDHETETIGAAEFVVAAYRQGDDEAAQRARDLSDAEYALRSTALRHQASSEVNSLPSMLRHVAMKFDLQPSEPDVGWVQRLLSASADPHMDKEIRKLPMPVRVAVLDYVDVRDDFFTMNEEYSDRVRVAKPAQ